MTPYDIKPNATPAEAEFLRELIEENPDAASGDLFLLFACLMAIGGIPMKPP